MNGARWWVGVGLVALLGGCGSSDDPEPAAPQEPTTAAAVATSTPSSIDDDAPSSSAPEPDPAPMTTSATATAAEPTHEASPEPEPEPEPVASDPQARAAELRAQFREANPEQTTDLPEGGSCDDQIEMTEDGTALAGCVTSSLGLVMFLVPPDPGATERDVADGVLGVDAQRVHRRGLRRRRVHLRGREPDRRDVPRVHLSLSQCFGASCANCAWHYGCPHDP